ncbi:hypothetical protein [Pseudomonas faucium]|uniref:hypothetical protein n=1 Tax=Pseudomonas faucium TaxID=2740518 RepID=UPI001F483767|nr:hypothetical protein [Pseudomonas faucium]
MSTFQHLWDCVDPYDGGLHVCNKCKRCVQGDRPKANDCTVSDAEHHAVAWLGLAGLYRTRLDAVRNFEQSVTPISADQLFELASRQTLSQLNEDRQRG